ncbi:hypothetical protein TB2_018927 [Malus domestica]
MFLLNIGTISSYSNIFVTRTHSPGDATRMIQFGDSDVMVAGGTESNIDALSTIGFCKYVVPLLYNIISIFVT